VSPTTPKSPADAYLTGNLSSNGGIPLWEYIETDDFWGKNSYFGDSGSGINQTFTEKQWRVGPFIATNVAGGFQKWTEADTFFLTRPTYPTYGNNYDLNVAVQLFPNPNYALLDCKLYTDAAATHLADTSMTGFYVNGYCTSGGSSATRNFNSINVPISIPDNNATGVNSVINVPVGLSDTLQVTVDVNITHTFLGNLVIQLIAPNGQMATLSDRQGNSADNFVVTGLDVSASFSTTTSPSGQWRLFVRDLAAFDVGAINSFTVHIRGNSLNDFSITSNPTSRTATVGASGTFADSGERDDPHETRGIVAPSRE
jgi:subtilisin-like proprotein convertase family protein